MKHTAFVLIILVSSYALKSQYLWQVSPGKVTKWNYYNGDEFNNGTLDDAKWLPNFAWSKAIVSQDIYYLEQNIVFNQGEMQLLVKKEANRFPLQPWEMDTVNFKKNGIRLTDGNKYPFQYTGGLIWSRQQYKYGYFEIKFKAPGGQGIWPAFWLFGAHPNNEIDFFELKGEKKKCLHVDIHCENGCANYKEGWFGSRRGWGHWIEADRSLQLGYHIVSGEWTANYIKWYLDGELIAYSNHAYDIAMNLIAEASIAKDGGPFKPGPNADTHFPNEFNVDYIRVYKSDTLPNYGEIKKNLSQQTENLNENTATEFSARKKTKTLKNNLDKTTKPGGLITLSVMQLGNNKLSVRVLGVSKNDSILVKVLDGNGQVIQNIKVDTDKEVSVTFAPCKTLKLHAEINQQVIDEELAIQ